jgi:glycosyltransferase involved in cell wall biosynthesis
MTQRKGLADLFEAMKRLGRRDVELVVMGAPLMPMAFYREEYPGFRHEPPRPHGAVLRLMGECDVLALPSIVEGRALVQQEAMRCGLPLIVTPNAGGEDLVAEGETGFLVPIRSPDAIADRIARLADDRGALEGMREKARAMAAGRSWGRYAAKIMEVLPG